MEPVSRAVAPNQGQKVPARPVARSNLAAAQTAIYFGLSEAAEFFCNAPAPVVKNTLSFFKQRGSEHFGVIASWSKQCKEIADSLVTELDVSHEGIQQLVNKMRAGDYKSLERLILPEEISNRELQQVMDAVQEKDIKIKELDLASCEFITRLPNNLPPGLIKLNLANCQQLRELPSNLPEGLKDLDASECFRIRAIPFLPNSLEKLSLNYCGRISAVTEPLPENLKVLSLRECSRLEGFPPHLPTTLLTLDLFGCINLQELPDQLPRTLRTLNIEYCDNLEVLPRWVPRGLRIIQ